MDNNQLTDNIDNDLLLKYIHGQTTDEQKRLIEEAMQHDEFLKDAVEGLKESNNPVLLNTTINSIHHSIGLKTGYNSAAQVGKVIKMPAVSVKAILAVAASVVIITGTYLIANSFFKSENKIAQNKTTTQQETVKQENPVTNEETESTPPPPPPIEDKISDETKDLESTTKAIEQKNVVLDQNVYTYDVTTAATGSTSPVTNAAPTYNWTLPTAVAKNAPLKNIVKGQVLDSKTKKPIAGANVISGKTTTLTSQNGYYEIALDDSESEIEISQSGYQDQAKKINVAGNKTINVELNQSFESDIVAMEKKDEDKIVGIKDKATTTTTANSTNDLKTGLDQYSNQEYEKAIVSFERVLQKNPDNAEANYYNGLANYNTNKNTKALGYFNKVIKANNKYSEDAKWQKAQILMQQNNYSGAKPILEELAKSSKYKNQAETILNTNR